MSAVRHRTVISIVKDFFKEWSVFPLTFWEVIEKMDWKGACESGVKAPYEVTAKRLVELTNDNPRIIDDINQTFRACELPTS